MPRNSLIGLSLNTWRIAAIMGTVFQRILRMAAADETLKYKLRDVTCDVCGCFPIPGLEL
jgi:hypothetical protein